MKPNLVKERLTDLGCCLRSQGPAEWTGEFELPNELLEFYKLVGPDSATIEAYGDPFFLPSLSGLDSHQIGYRSHPKTGERFSDWLDEWIVVADASVDPFIYCRGEILFAEHGTGKWSPYPMFVNIYDMAGALATIGLVVQDAGQELTDDEFNILPHHRDRAISELAKTLDSTTAKLTIKSLGWGDAG